MTHRVFISAAHKSSGKTTVSIGLCAALAQRGRHLQAFKKGPDYIDPMWLGRAAGHPCHNLDFYTSSPAEILDQYHGYTRAADIALIEGNKGLYDGLDLDGSNSNAALARLLAAPVLLVIDAQGMTRGIAPLILGYQAFEPGIDIAGIVLNKLGGSRHEAKLRAVIEHYTDVPVLGAVYKDKRLEIVERHLGLVPSNEDSTADRRIALLGERMAEQIDLDAVEACAARAPALPGAGAGARETTKPLSPDLRIGIMRDAAFGFYYPGDLEALEAAGAQLHFIDALTDTRLPAIDGLFIGGGFPETQMQALERNSALRGAVHDAVEAGLATYAECGGLMYLCKSLSWNGRQHAMAGVIPAHAVMCERPQGRGYVRLKETGLAPWRLGPDPAHNAEIPGHEFHYSRLERFEAPVNYAYEVLRGSGIEPGRDGIVHKNLLASYAHLRSAASCPWAARFAAFIREHKRGGRAQKPGALQHAHLRPPHSAFGAK